MNHKLLLIIYLAFLIMMSFITLILFKKDKSIAKKGSNSRIQEKTLLGFCAFGGALGGFLGRIFFRHKTDKIYFSIVIYVSLLIQIIAVVVLGLYAFNMINF